MVVRSNHFATRFHVTIRCSFEGSCDATVFSIIQFEFIFHKITCCSLDICGGCAMFSASYFELVTKVSIPLPRLLARAGEFSNLKVQRTIKKENR